MVNRVSSMARPKAKVEGCNNGVITRLTPQRKQKPAKCRCAAAVCRPRSLRLADSASYRECESEGAVCLMAAIVSLRDPSACKRVQGKRRRWRQRPATYANASTNERRRSTAPAHPPPPFVTTKVSAHTHGLWRICPSVSKRGTKRA